MLDLVWDCLCWSPRMPNALKILLIEADNDLSESLVRALENEGFKPQPVKTPSSRASPLTTLRCHRQRSPLARRRCRADLSEVASIPWSDAGYFPELWSHRITGTGID